MTNTGTITRRRVIAIIPPSHRPRGPSPIGMITVRVTSHRRVGARHPDISLPVIVPLPHPQVAAGPDLMTGHRPVTVPGPGASRLLTAPGRAATHHPLNAPGQVASRLLAIVPGRKASHLLARARPPDPAGRPPDRCQDRAPLPCPGHWGRDKTRVPLPQSDPSVG